MLSDISQYEYHNLSLFFKFGGGGVDLHVPPFTTAMDSVIFKIQAVLDLRPKKKSLNNLSKNK